MSNPTLKPLHRQTAIAHDAMLSRDVATCSLMVLEALQEHVCSDRISWHDQLIEKHGTSETREEILAMAVAIEEAHGLLQTHFDGEFNDLMMDIWGCYDFDFVPAMVAVIMNDGNECLLMHCIEKGEAFLNEIAA